MERVLMVLDALDGIFHAVRVAATGYIRRAPVRGLCVLAFVVMVAVRFAAS